VYLCSENSGIPQGTIVKRHRFLRDVTDGHEEQGYYTVQDLNVGIELSLYGRVVRLVACDEFTKVCIRDSRFVIFLQ
jgi:hypothetical protein